MIESINLNLIPSGVSPVCHVSQYDAGRQIKINLFEGINPYTIQSGDSFTLNVRKPDNTIVTTSVSGTQGDNHITISTTEQIAAVVGANLCELKITNGSTVIGTLNFIMLVERDVLADGIPSQSVIKDLNERIAKAIGDNYYNKTETDALLDNKADKSTTYTKTETDALLALKADKSNTYTKTETDDLLALKADKTEFYNFYPTEQESGAIAHFTDGADNIPVKSLVSEIVAVESGSGEKSPENPYTISGFDSGVVPVSGKNLIGFPNVDFTIANMRFYSDGTAIKMSGTSTSEISSINTNFKENLAFTLPVGVYYISTNTPTGLGIYLRRYSDNALIASLIPYATVTLTETTKVYFGIYVPNNKTLSDHNTQFNITKGGAATTYEAYNGNTYTFTFGQTVYGGHFDNKGNLVVTHKAWITNGTENWIDSGDGNYYTTSHYSFDSLSGSSDGKSNYFTYIWSFGQTNGCMAYTNRIQLTKTSFASVEDLQAAFSQTPLVIVYPLATPITLAITSQDIPTLLGENNIFSNTGDVDVTIRADIGLYIDKRLNANRSTPNNLSRAAAYVEDPESVNETQEDNVEPQNEER